MNSTSNNNQLEELNYQLNSLWQNVHEEYC
jgi:hypothetical protein